VEYHVPDGFSQRLYNRIKGKQETRDLISCITRCLLGFSRTAVIFRSFIAKEPMADLTAVEFCFRDTPLIIGDGQRP
jgi:hypothetical protein